jgi:hypothetical protein
MDAFAYTVEPSADSMLAANGAVELAFTQRFSE